MRFRIYLLLIPVTALSQSTFWQMSGSGITDPVKYISTDWVGTDSEEVFVATDHAVFATRNNGQTWVDRSQGLDSTRNLIGLANGQGDYVFCLDWGGSGINHVYRSTNSGLVWSHFTPYVPDAYWGSSESQSIFKSDRFGRIWITGAHYIPAGSITTHWSGDNGTTWWGVEVNSENILMGDVASTPQADIFVCGRDRWSEQQVLRSTNGGSWIKSSLASYSWTPPRSIGATTQGVVCVAIDQVGIYRSIQNGDPGSWSVSNQGLQSRMIRSLIVTDSNHIYGASDSGIFLSSDRGSFWAPVNDGLDTLNVKTLALSSRGFLFALTTTGHLYRSMLRVTSVTSDHSDSPLQFSLSQNYPNPFNPRTTIQFSVGHLSRVSLKILDILGREVATIVAGERASGTYSETWDAGGAASGVYYCKLVTDGFVAVRRMVVLK